MTSTELTTYVIALYFLSGIGFLVACIATAPESRARKIMFGVLCFVWVLHTASIGFRWVESYQMGIGHAPLSNLYESLIFFAWCIALALIVIRLRFRTDSVVLVGLPFVFLTMAYTFLLDHSIKPLIPALQSNWLVAHVITCFLGYAGFTVSFVAAVLYLISKESPGVGKFSPKGRISRRDRIPIHLGGISLAHGGYHHRCSMG